MTTLWETITGNSSLPIQSGNNFWDHLNSQSTDSSTIEFVNGFEISVDEENIEVSMAEEIKISVESDQIGIAIDDKSIAVITNETVSVTVDSGAEIIVGECRNG